MGSVDIRHFSYFLLMLYYGLTVWGQQRKLRRAGPATARPRRVSRYGATLTPHSHGGPEVSGGRQGDQAAAVEDLLMHRPALSQNICQSCAPRRVVLPWSIIQVAQSPEASYFSCARQKALKSVAQQKDKFERPRGAPGISTVSISDSRDLRICVRRSRESERWS